MAALQDVIVDEPKATREKGAFTRGQAIEPVFALVSQNKVVLDEELFFDGAKRSAHARFVRRKKANKRQQQQACIEPLRTVGLHEAVKLGIETTLTDIGVDIVGDLAPPLP